MNKTTFCVSLLVVAGFMGCVGREEVVHYQTARQAPIKSPGKQAKQSNQRMLAAIISHGQTWFFKMVGPTPVVTEHRDEFEEFMKSVRFDGDGKVVWSLPEGWKELPGSESRYATLKIESAGLEVTVTAMGGDAGGLLANVNRWRGQIGLEPIAEKDLGEVTREIKLGEETATLVDLVGAAAASDSALPAGHPPIQAGGTERPRSPLKYSVPEGWKELPPPNAFSVVFFETVVDGKKAETSVSVLGGLAGGLSANVNRWRDQVGLAPIEDEQLTKDLRPLEVAGKTAHYVELAGSQSAILGVILEQESQSWFFKMRGPADVVLGQKAAFEEFVRSVQFEQ